MAEQPVKSDAIRQQYAKLVHSSLTQVQNALNGGVSPGNTLTNAKTLLEMREDLIALCDHLEENED